MLNSQPIVRSLSIITLCRNDLKGLKRTIESLQILRKIADIQPILVDGNSSDGSIEYALSTNIFDVIIYDQTRGIYNAMNAAIPFLNRDFVVFNNSSDVLIPKYCLKALELSGNAAWISCGILIANGESIIKYRKPPSSKLPLSMPSLHPGTIYALKLLKQHPFSESFKYASDFYQLHKISENHKPLRINFPISVFDTKNSSSNRIASLNETFRAAVKLRKSTLPVLTLHYLIILLTRFLLKI